MIFVNTEQQHSSEITCHKNIDVASRPRCIFFLFVVNTNVDNLVFIFTGLG